tara:strand:- start:2057 stop:2200 length:144 start_codon:yes stop_codon:yes gene_type:complete
MWICSPAIAENEYRFLEGIKHHRFLDQQRQAIDLLTYADRIATLIFY